LSSGRATRFFRLKPYKIAFLSGSCSITEVIEQLYYIFNNRMVSCKKGGKTKDRGRDVKNPTHHPFSQIRKKPRRNPTLIMVITRDIHMDIITAMQKPKKKI
jgi:hypothetical protein